MERGKGPGGPWKRELGFIPTATEACGNFSLECDVIQFNSLKDHLVYSKENGIVAVSIQEKKKERCEWEGDYSISLFLLVFIYFERER